MSEQCTGCPGLRSKSTPQKPENGADLTAKVPPDPPIGRLLPALSPNTPAFRAIPFPEVTEPICRLPLPTLFYRPEAVYLGDLLRIWVRAGANRRSPQLDFQGPARRPWTQRELLCSWQYQNPFSSQRNSRASVAYAEKITLPRIRTGVSSSVRVATRKTRLPNGYATRLRNKNLIPFRLRMRLHLPIDHRSIEQCFH